MEAFNEIDFERLKMAVGTMAHMYAKVGGEHLKTLQALNCKLQNQYVKLTPKEVMHCRVALNVVSEVAKDVDLKESQSLKLLAEKMGR